MAGVLTLFGAERGVTEQRISSSDHRHYPGDRGRRHAGPRRGLVGIMLIIVGSLSAPEA
jgi:hypothetical protein